MQKQIETDTPPVSSKQISTDTPPRIKVIKPLKMVGGKYICYYDNCPYKTLTAPDKYYCPFKGCIFQRKDKK